MEAGEELDEEEEQEVGEEEEEVERREGMEERHPRHLLFHFHARRRGKLVAVVEAMRRSLRAKRLLQVANPRRAAAAACITHLCARVWQSVLVLEAVDREALALAGGGGGHGG